MREYFLLSVHIIMFSTVLSGIYPIRMGVEPSTKYMLNILMRNSGISGTYVIRSSAWACRPRIKCMCYRERCQSGQNRKLQSRMKLKDAEEL